MLVPHYSPYSNLIEEIKSKLTIEDMISRYLPPMTFRQRRNKLWACCPLHEEKTPSFYIEPAKGRWRCFGCGEYGDGLDLVAKCLKLQLKDVVGMIANDLGIFQKNISKQTSDKINKEWAERQYWNRKADEFNSRLKEAYCSIAGLFRDCHTIIASIKDENDLERTDVAIAFQYVDELEYIMDELISEDAERQFAAMITARRLGA